MNQSQGYHRKIIKRWSYIVLVLVAVAAVVLYLLVWFNSVPPTPSTPDRNACGISDFTSEKAAREAGCY